MMEKSHFTTSRHFYKPFATRSPVLIFLLLLTLSLIAFTEYACRNIPLHTGTGKLGNVVNNTLKLKPPRDLEQWQSEAYLPTTGVVSITGASLTTESPILSEETPYYPSFASTPAWGGYLSLGDDENPSVTIAPNSGYLSLGDEAAPTIPAGSPNSGYLSIPDGLTQTAPPDEIVYPTIAATPAAGYLEVGGSEMTESSADATATQNAPSSGYISLDGESVILAPDATPTPYLVVENGVTLTETPATVMTATGGYPKITATAPGGYLEVTPTPASPHSGYLKTSSSSAPKPVATVVNSTGTYYVYKDGQSIIAPQINLQQYLLVSFVPLIVAVLFTVPWRIMDTTIREMEPFYQLHQDGGARAEHSLCLDYSTSFLLTTPFKSVFRGHFFVFWSSLISVAVLMLAPLSSEAFFVSLTGQCGPNLPPCRATWGIYIFLARTIEGILAFIAILVAFLLLFGLRRKSGVYSEPLSIAGLAALYHNSPLLRGFKEIDNKVDNDQLDAIMAGKRYGISSYTTYDYKPCYGILPVDPDSEAGFPSIVKVGKKGQYRLVDGDDVPRDAFGIPFKSEEVEVKIGIWTRIKDHLLYSTVCVLTSGLLALITYYHWSSGESGFERFMDSQGFGVRFMMAGLGVLLKSLWSTIDQDLRKMEPYRRLLLGGSKPEDSILVPVWMGPFSALVPSLRRRHFLISLICFVSILSEFLPIALANISFSPAMLKEAYEWCNYVAMAILTVMLGSVLVLIFRPRQHVRPLPRKPTTLASVLLYITDRNPPEYGEHEYGFLDAFGGLSTLSTTERNDYIMGLRNLYTLGIGGSNDLRIDEDRRIHRLWVD